MLSDEIIDRIDAIVPLGTDVGELQVASATAGPYNAQLVAYALR
jgi:hypothetical protein